MLTDATLVQRHFVKATNDQIEQLKEQLSAGLIDDIKEYKRIAGQIQGLRDALDHLAEAHDQVQKTA